jgi:toxin ParE1/3/4
MPLRVFPSLSAEQDLQECSEYIHRHNPAAAFHFLDAAEAAFKRLGEIPELGEPCGFRRPDLRDLRACTIEGFRNYVIYYRIVGDRIEVVRVVHGARDRKRLFPKK